MKYPAFMIMIFLSVSAFAAPAQEARQLQLSAAGIHVLAIRCGAGSLILSGVDSGNPINVTAEIEAEGFTEEELQPYIEKKVILKLEKKGAKATLQSEINRSPLMTEEIRINLRIEVPRGIDVVLNDGSGVIRIRDYSGNLRIYDDSGHITVENIIGNVRIEDSSGGIRIEDIKGHVEVKDGSGSIQISRIKGDVRVTDGSGSMLIQYIDGNVTVADDSGSIDISNVSKTVFIREAGSGELNIERIKGKVTTHGPRSDLLNEKDANP